MKKEALVYILIFILSFALTSASLYYFTQNKKTASAKADSLKQGVKTDSVFSDTTEEEKPVEQVDEAPKQQENYTDEEKEFLKLVEKIKNIHGYKTEQPVSKEEQEKYQAKVDSSLTALKKEVESYKRDKERLTRDISEYKASIRKKDEVIRNQNTKITEYESKMTTLRSDIEKENKIQKQKESSENLKGVVKIYNNMDPKKAAEFIQNMPMNKGILILKSLNQKKAAKIMAAMRPQMAAAYSQKLAE